MLKLIEWIKLLFSSSDVASTKRVVFVLVALVGAGFLGTSLHAHGLTDAWVSSFQAYLTFAGGSYLGGKAVDMIGLLKGITNPTPDATEPTDTPKAE